MMSKSIGDVHEAAERKHGKKANRLHPEVTPEIISKGVTKERNVLLAPCGEFSLVAALHPINKYSPQSIEKPPPLI